VQSTIIGVTPRRLGGHPGRDLTVTKAGSKTPIIGPIATWLDDGEISTVVMRDAPAGGPPYGLIELDDGLLPVSLAE
jgi:hypothetical protein